MKQLKEKGKYSFQNVPADLDSKIDFLGMHSERRREAGLLSVIEWIQPRRRCLRVSKGLGGSALRPRREEKKFGFELWVTICLWALPWALWVVLPQKDNKLVVSMKESHPKIDKNR